MDVSALIIKLALGILAGEEQGSNCITRSNGNRFFEMYRVLLAHENITEFEHDFGITLTYILAGVNQLYGHVMSFTDNFNRVCS